MTAKEVTIRLFWQLRGNSQVMIPRYTPRDWWECDLWRLTKGDATEEYEVKLSVADFKADFKKSKRGRITYRGGLWDEAPGTMKHELLATSTAGPNRFFYVMPLEIAGLVEIPAYAGLWVFRGRYLYRDKKAPERHGGKCEITSRQLLHTMYHRYWNHEAAHKGDFTPSEAG